MKNALKLLLTMVLLCAMLPGLVRADLVVMALNTEWLWSPLDGRIDGEKVRIKEPGLTAYHEELAHYASVIVKQEADVVALAEIEGRHVADDLREHLPKGWRVAFEQGGDTATGQDVAILTRLQIEADTITNFGLPLGYLPGDRKGKKLTKVLGLRVVHPDLGEQKVAVVTAHLLSKRNDSKRKARKRLKQASALAQSVDVIQKQATAVIVLGDLNDYPDSPVINLVKERNALEDAASVCDQRGARRSKVDYVLYRGLRCLNVRYLKMQPFSDHPAVVARFN